MKDPSPTHEASEDNKGYWSAEWTLPEVDCQLSLHETATYVCIEVVNFETGMILAHLDIYKDNVE